MTLSMLLAFRYNIKITIYKRSNKVDFIKNKNICSAIDKIRGMKRKATELKNICKKQYLIEDCDSK